MRSSDILDAIGQVDDGCVKKAKEKKRANKKVWITVSSLAACVMLACMAPFIYIASRGAGAADPEAMNKSDGVIARVDIKTHDGSLSYASKERTASIYHFIEDSIKTKQGQAALPDFDEKLQPNEYAMTLTDHNGAEMSYRFYMTTFYDLNAGMRYELTSEELAELLDILGLSE